MAMAMALRDAFALAERSAEFQSHYFVGGALESFLGKITAHSGSGFFLGHYLFGALPNRPRRAWVTQFRHPLPRVLSAFNWLKRIHEARTGESFQKLNEFVERSGGLAHSQIAQLGLGFGGLRDSSIRKKLMPSDVYELGMNALEREILWFGIAEMFEESLFSFASLVGLPAVLPWLRDERNPGRPLSSEVSADSVKLIEEVFHYDYLLYSFALTSFRKRTLSFAADENLVHYKSFCLPQYNDRILP